MKRGEIRLPLSWLYSNSREGVISSARVFTGKELVAYANVPHNTELFQVQHTLNKIYPKGYILHGLSQKNVEMLMGSGGQCSAFGSVNSIDCNKKLRSIITNQIKRVEKTHSCVFFDEEDASIMAEANQVISASQGESSGLQIVGLFREVYDRETIRCAAYNRVLERVDAVVSASYVGERSWHLEAFARHKDALSGCTELAIQSLTRKISEIGDQWLLLGETPFLITSKIPRIDKRSGLIEASRKSICYLGRKNVLSYPVEGLYQYKKKFNKRNWETVYWYGYPSLSSADMLGAALATNSLAALIGNYADFKKKIEFISNYFHWGQFRNFSFKCTESDRLSKNDVSTSQRQLSISR